jgi:hypothetical protein
MVWDIWVLNAKIKQIQGEPTCNDGLSFDVNFELERNVTTITGKSRITAFAGQR